MRFKGVFRVLQRSILRKIEGCFDGVLMGFQGYLKVVQCVFEEGKLQRGSKDVSRKF